MVLTLKNITKEQLSIVLRDLSDNLNNNVKDSILNYDKKPKINNSTKKIKKKDIIIQNQNKLREKNDNIKDEKLFLNFKSKNYTNCDIYFYYNYLKNFKTDKIKEKFKLYVLEIFYNKPKKNMQIILGLYFQLNYIKNNDLIDKITNKIKDYDYNLYMLKNLGHILPPLNYWDTKFKLEDWQTNAIKNIKNKKPTIVKAPTSSGKSYISLSAGLFHKKVLYVCPSNAVAYQIGSYFYKFNYKYHLILNNICETGYDKNCNIFIGTPDYIEKYIYKLNLKFDYIVYDEINLFTKEYENIIKLLGSNFIALSATIKNIDKLKLFLDNVHNINTDIILYDKRFINIQNWKINSNFDVEKIHPLSSYSKDDMDLLINKSIKCTPNDISTLYETLYDLCEEIDDETLEEFIDQISPDEYFSKNKLSLSLDTAKKYEIFLLNKLNELKKNYPDLLNNLFNKFNNPYTKINDTDILQNIKNVCDKCKKNKMFPMLIFNNNDKNCEELFYKLYEELCFNENLDYPYHYDILEKKQDFYKKYMDKRNTLQNNISLKKEETIYSIENKLNNFDKKSLNDYTVYMTNIYNSLIEKINKNDLSEKIKHKQIKNLKKELVEFLDAPDLCYQDIYKKHKNFCYNLKETMSGNEIKSIRKKIIKELDISIPYEHPIFQMLKRGIGLYIKSMPSIYLDLLQTLLSNKNIGIIISGKELSLGIDLPVVSTMLIEYNNSKFNKDEYYQMSGRAGRRGKESTGNVIFLNVDYNNLMKSDLPEIIGSNKSLYSHYHSLKKISLFDSELVFKNSFNKTKLYENTDININLKNINEKTKFNLLWEFKYYKNIYNFLLIIDKLETDIVNIHNNFDKYIHILTIIKDIFNINVISNFKSNNIDNNYNNIINIVIILINHLNKTTYENSLIVLNELYNILKKLIFKNNKLLD